MGVTGTQRVTVERWRGRVLAAVLTASTLAAAPTVAQELAEAHWRLQLTADPAPEPARWQQAVAGLLAADPDRRLQLAAMRRLRGAVAEFADRMEPPEELDALFPVTFEQIGGPT